MGKFKDNKEKNNEKEKYLKVSTFGKYLGWKEKKNIYMWISCIRLVYDTIERKEKKYPTQMNDIVTPGFLLLPTHTVYC